MDIIEKRSTIKERILKTDLLIKEAKKLASRGENRFGSINE